MRIFIIVICAVFAGLGCDCARAQAQGWEPTAGHTQIAIWAGAAPDARVPAGAERVSPVNDPKELVAGKPWTEVENVSRPTMTVYSPTVKNTGVAVVVFPGGGYEILAIDLEGTEVCDWLTSRGITCVLLKYRVPAHLPGENWGMYRNSKMALDDAQRTMGLVRLHAAEWHVDPHKIGVLGFSAGGHLVAATTTNFEKRLYPAADDADKESCRPDFGVALYPGHLWNNDKHFDNPTVQVSRNTPPTFIVQAEDDPVDSVNNSLAYYAALKKAGVPVEMHLYAHGGHAFGLRRTKEPITAWPELVEKWLRTIGMVSD